MVRDEQRVQRKRALERRRRPHRPRSHTRSRASLRHRPRARSSPTPLALIRRRGAFCQPLSHRNVHTLQEIWRSPAPHLGSFRPPQLREHTPRDARARTPSARLLHSRVSTTQPTRSLRTSCCTWTPAPERESGGRASRARAFLKLALPLGPEVLRRPCAQPHHRVAHD
jgi:hypothetical protein